MTGAQAAQVKAFIKAARAAKVDPRALVRATAARMFALCEFFPEGPLTTAEMEEHYGLFIAQMNDVSPETRALLDATNAKSLLDTLSISDLRLLDILRRQDEDDDVVFARIAELDIALARLGHYRDWLTEFPVA